MFQMIERVSEDPPRSKEGEMLKTTTKEIEFPVECTLLEVLCVVDVKDPVVPVQLCVREWLDGRLLPRCRCPRRFYPGLRARVAGRVSVCEAKESTR